ncbi:MAG: hypothetical protein COZ06_34710 [Armatimonadetes bacterium CG_4_10_14_3_um_filter_66_18]|nr:DUF5060 domain-containing protein [Armatimonadota bacterium]OIO98811.1 MAG: hypothetical protein AUJ96_20460 [Armatimonadetes bacterium CG2_30_66_41]PIX46413.1 MAG: hypothetical protein COZ57_12215 [Armatimonadetes bacterium CG_4_8_14_3_um_filter_66_20]PIY36781.1 MAG: hypothetical protein COZ06_34710 [Armatimonadetes bacterium CG_4_10_14_3_um_filter_66_18]PIZ50578.1 MAG: hypothetical protein COY42_01280 [Armatimonadetes bacterium CG_4_10_14_0_8_um_filter_66_14]PJB60235.1 MAG: hypothetical p
MQRQAMFVVCLCAWVAGMFLARSPALAEAPRSLNVTLAERTVARFSKLELILAVQPVGENPDDPNEVDLRVELTSPGGRHLVIPAFYSQAFERRQLDKGGRQVAWLYPVGSPEWKVRFAPTEVGTYTGAVKLRDGAGDVESRAFSFDCVPSESSGFVRVSAQDPRFLEFADGKPFFVLGQNVAFIKSLGEAEDMFAKLGADGANYVRVWACCEDWAMGVEARKSAWGRSWEWAPPLVQLPGREGYHSAQRCVQIAGKEGASIALSPTRDLATQPDTRYLLTGKVRTDNGVSLRVEVQGTPPAEPLSSPGKWTAFRHEFTTGADQWWLPGVSFALTAKGSAWVRELSLREADDGPELLEEADANRPVRGRYNQLDCFMLDQLVEAAERNGLYLQLCLLTRDHYMADLTDARSGKYGEAVADAEKLLRYAVARWGYSTHVATWEYFNEIDPGLPLERFYTECGDYLERTDPYHHLRTASHWNPAPKWWKNAALDLADEHYYMRPNTGPLFKDAVASVLGRAAELRAAAPSKPALLSEFGMTADNWQRTDYLDKDKDFTHLHNALWASALSGLSGTVMDWFWDDVHKRDLYSLYRPVAAFTADVPFTTGKLRRIAAAASPDRLRLVGLQGDDRAYLWLNDAEASWWNLNVEGRTPERIQDASIEIKGLPVGRYHVAWWDTFAGRPTEPATVTAGAHSLQLDVPAFLRDTACKLVPAPR